MNRTNKSLEYFFDFVDCTQNLPLDIQRYVTRMLEWDIEYQEMMSCIKELTDKYNDHFEPNVDKLTKLLVSELDLGDKKLQAVKNISKLIDNRVKCLENDRKFFISVKKSDIPKPNVKEKTESTNCLKERSLPSSSTITVSKELKKHNTNNDSSESNNNVKIKKRKADELDYKEVPDVALTALKHSHRPFPRATATAQVQSQVKLKRTTQKTKAKTEKKGKNKKQPKDNSQSLDENDDILVYPNEPTYCLCDQIFYGTMICCDNNLCPIQWFHFACVTLSTKPKGKWFCPKCRGDRPNIMKPKAQFLRELECYNKEK